MKKILNIIMAFTVLAMISCKKDPVPEPEPEVTYQILTLEFGKSPNSLIKDAPTVAIIMNGNGVKEPTIVIKQKLRLGQNQISVPVTKTGNYVVFATNTNYLDNDVTASGLLSINTTDVENRVFPTVASTAMYMNKETFTISSPNWYMSLTTPYKYQVGQSYWKIAP